MTVGASSEVRGDRRPGDHDPRLTGAAALVRHVADERRTRVTAPTAGRGAGRLSGGRGDRALRLHRRAVRALGSADH